MEKVSVILLSFKRPENLNKNIKQLVSYNVIDEIIIAHGHKDYINYINDPKVKNLYDWDNNDKYYTLRRFKHGDIVKNNCVLLLDDDICPSKKLLNKMIKEYKKDPLNIYGPEKRYCGKDYYSTKFLHQLLTYLICMMMLIIYFKRKIVLGVILFIFIVLKISIKKYNVILTGICLTDKKVIQNCWRSMIKNRLFNEVIKNKGNCEDLLFNSEFKKIYNKRPVYIRDGYIIGFNIGSGFSTSNPYKHYIKRKKFCNTLQF